jgi:threonine/homoserine/homoserine lactone efflux protein
MPTLDSLTLFAVAAVGLLLFPGPSVIYIVSTSVRHGRRKALASMLGVNLGGWVHVIAAAVGVSALLAASAIAFSALKLAGAAYLVVLGVRELMAARRGDEAVTAPPSVGAWKVLRRGVLVNATNPKTALFFYAFLPQFADPGRGSVILQILLLGAMFQAIGLVTDGTYAIAAASAGGVLRRTFGGSRRLRALPGLVYIGLGVAALSGRSARA